jgi:hypothetical protein
LPSYYFSSHHIIAKHNDLEVEIPQYLHFRVEKGGRELLVAVSFGLAASEAVADRRSSFQIKQWEAYARLYKKVELLHFLYLLRVVNFNNIQDRYLEILNISQNFYSLMLKMPCFVKYKEIGF